MGCSGPGGGLQGSGACKARARRVHALSPQGGASWVSTGASPQDENTFCGSGLRAGYGKHPKNQCPFLQCVGGWNEELERRERRERGSGTRIDLERAGTRTWNDGPPWNEGNEEDTERERSRNEIGLSLFHFGLPERNDHISSARSSLFQVILSSFQPCSSKVAPGQCFLHPGQSLYAG